jgi:hypothetical protein
MAATAEADIEGEGERRGGDARAPQAESESGVATAVSVPSHVAAASHLAYLRPRPRPSLAPRSGRRFGANNPRLSPTRREVGPPRPRRQQLGRSRRFPWLLVAGVALTTLVAILCFKLTEVIPEINSHPAFLWSVKLSVLVMLTGVLLRFKAAHNNSIFELSPVDSGTTLRELQTLAALGVAANNVIGGAGAARRTEAERVQRRARAKRAQAAQLIETLPLINVPEVPSRTDVGAGDGSAPGGGGDQPDIEQQAIDEQGVCSICLGAWSDEQCTKLSCGHMFHHDCISSWLLDGTGRNLRCPLCNLVLKTIEDDDEEEVRPRVPAFDTALAADWMVTAAQHAFIMQMAASVREVLEEERIEVESSEQTDGVGDSTADGGRMGLRAPAVSLGSVEAGSSSSSSSSSATEEGVRPPGQITVARDRRTTPGTAARRTTITPYGAAVATAYFGAAAAVAAAAGVLPGPTISGPGVPLVTPQDLASSVHTADDDTEVDTVLTSATEQQLVPREPTSAGAAAERTPPAAAAPAWPATEP